MPKQPLLWAGLIVVLTAALLFAISPRYRPVPSDDPSVYLYVGDTIRAGGMPYRDAWDHKQPLAYLIYAAALTLTPHALWGIWLLELVGLTAAGLLAYQTLRRAASPWVSFLAVIAGLLALEMIIWGYSLEELALPLQWVTLSALIPLTHAPRARSRLQWGIAAGLAVGAAFFLKQTLIGAGLAVGAYLLADLLIQRSWRSLPALLGLAAGTGLAALPLLAYLSLGGAIPDYWSAVFQFNLAYAGLGPVERVKALAEALLYLTTLPGLLAALLLWVGCLGVALLQAGPTLARAVTTRGFRLAALTLGVGLIGLSLGAELFGRQPGFGLFQTLALGAGAISLLTGLLAGIPAAWDRVSAWLAALPDLTSLPGPAADSPGDDRRAADRRALLWLAVLYFPIALALVTLSGRGYVYYFIPLVPGLTLELGVLGGIFARSRLWRGRPAVRWGAAALLVGLGAALAYPALNQLIGAYRAPANPPLPAVAAYVADNTTPQDTIYVWGKDITYAYFLTGRSAPTRYFYQAPVSLQAYNDQMGVSAEIYNAVQARPPRLFMVLTADPAPPPPGTCPLPAADVPNSPGQIFQFVCSRYRYDVTLGEFQVYRLK